MSPISSKIIFRGPFFESAATFFVFILKFIFTAILESKFTKKFLVTRKKFHFRRPIFSNPFRQSRKYLTPTVWELKYDLQFFVFKNYLNSFYLKNLSLFQNIFKVTPAGNSTVWSTVSSPTVWCLMTSLQDNVMTHLTRSFPKRDRESTFLDQFLSI